VGRYADEEATIEDEKHCYVGEDSSQLKLCSSLTDNRQLPQLRRARGES
jgi:hypothetical protein